MNYRMTLKGYELVGKLRMFRHGVALFLSTEFDLWGKKSEWETEDFKIAHVLRIIAAEYEGIVPEHVLIDQTKRLVGEGPGLIDTMISSGYIEK